MNSLKDALESRTKSSFNISIGTGIALEALFTPTDTRYDETLEIQQFTKDYSYLFISIYTLIRNIVAALDTPSKKRLFNTLNYKELIDILLEEIEIISTVADTVDKEVIFFPFREIKLFPINYLSDGKPTQNHYILNLYKSILDKIDLKDINSDYTFIKDYRKRLKRRDSITLTALGLDLLDYEGYLLNSHTATIYSKDNFNRKYHSLRHLDMTILPFNDILYKIYGDNTGVIRLPKPKFRRDMYEWLVKNKVNPKRSREWTKRVVEQF